MKYRVNIKPDNKHYGLTQDFYEEGERIVFKVAFVTDMHTSVTSSDVSLEALPSEGSQLLYSFVMPAHEVSVEVKRWGSMMRDPSVNHPFMGFRDMRGTGSMATTQNNQSTKASLEGADAKFCRECGARIPREAKFCGECGVRCTPKM